MLVTISLSLFPRLQLLCHVFMLKYVCIFVRQASAIIITLQKVLFHGQEHVISFFYYNFVICSFSLLQQR